MQLDAENLERAELAVKRFRRGGACIAAFPLIFSLLHLVLRGGGAESGPFTVMSICLLFLVLWIAHCAERFLKALRPAP